MHQGSKESKKVPATSSVKLEARKSNSTPKCARARARLMRRWVCVCCYNVARAPPARQERDIAEKIAPHSFWFLSFFFFRWLNPRVFMLSPINRFLSLLGSLTSTIIHYFVLDSRIKSSQSCLTGRKFFKLVKFKYSITLPDCPPPSYSIKLKRSFYFSLLLFNSVIHMIGLIWKSSNVFLQ